MGSYQGCESELYLFSRTLHKPENGHEIQAQDSRTEAAPEAPRNRSDKWSDASTVVNLYFEHKEKLAQILEIFIEVDDNYDSMMTSLGCYEISPNENLPNLPIS